MAKVPANQFYHGDWLRDPELRACSYATRGFWMDVLCLMREAGGTGTLTGTVQDFRRMTGGDSDEQVIAAVEELSTKGAADVIWHDRSGKNVTCHTLSLKNRRMSREYNERIGARKRKQKQRDRGNASSVTRDSRKSHGNVTAPSSSSSYIGKSDPKNIDQSSSPPGRGSQSSPRSPPEEKLSTEKPEPEEKLSTRKPGQASRWTADAVPEDWIQWAIREEKFSPALARREAAKFVDHWRSASGARARKVEWFATWRNWIRRETDGARKISQGNGGQGGRPLSAVERVERATGLKGERDTDDGTIIEGSFKRTAH